MNKFKFTHLLPLALLAACGDEAGPVSGQDVADTEIADDTVEPDVDASETDGSDPDVTDSDTAEDTELPPDGSDVETTDVPDTTDTTDTTDTNIEPEICAELAPVEGGGCQIEAGGPTILLRGTILAASGPLIGGEVLIAEDGTIECAACDCGGSASAAGATIITCPDGVVSPGLINAHDHITYTQLAPSDWGTERYDHRHDWRRGLRGHTEIPAPRSDNPRNWQWGELRHVMSGVTSLAGSGTVSGFLRNIDKDGDAEAIGQGAAFYATFPLDDTDGTLQTNSCEYGDLPGTSALSTDCYLAHVAEGVDAAARNEFLCLSSTANGGVDVTEENGAFIHLVGLTAIDAATLALDNVSHVWSPRSNISLYGNTAPVTIFANAGVNIALGTDWTASGSANLGRELACVREYNDTQLGGFFSNYEIWRMVTANAAFALKIDEVVGAIDTGLIADLAIFNNSLGIDPYEAVIAATPQDTMLVLRGGQTLYGDSAIVASMPDGEGCEEIPEGVCGAVKSACVSRELGITFAELAAENATAYDLFFCGVPPTEPTCVPSRPGEYDGISVAGDSDGDGIASDADNCPTVFNPVRPVDGSKQGDFDRDGVGDACDACPLSVGTENCAPFDPADLDGDGALEAVDNCPGNPNRDQADADTDQIGDVCDICPDFANPGGGACPVSIYDIKIGDVGVGANVIISGVTSGIGNGRMFVQVPAADQDPELGARYSGIFIFLGTSTLTPPAIGDVVEITGTVSEFFGQIQVSGVTSMTVTGTAPLAPVIVDPASVATGGADAEAYESVFVMVDDVDIVDVAPAAGASDPAPTNEFTVTGDLRINDLYYLTTPFPLPGDTYDFSGPLRFANGNTKLEPRSAADVVLVASLPPSIVGLEPGAAFIENRGAGQLHNTFPEPLTILLDRPASAGGTTIELSGDSATLEFPENVVIPAGQRSAVVQIGGLALTDAPAELTATLEGTSFSSEIEVISVDRVATPLFAEPSEVILGAGGTAIVTIELDVPAAFPSQTFAIASSPAGALGVPEEVVVPGGELFFMFEVDSVEPGDFAVFVDPEGVGFTIPVTVLEAPPLGLVLSELFYDANTGSAGDNGLEWVEIYNGTSSTIDLAGYSLGYGGGNYAAGKYQLSGSIAPFGCIVVGGVTTGPENFSPTFALARDFAPDIQNSGAVADGIGLFNVAATALTNTTVPIDALIYGEGNGDAFLSPAGTPAAAPNAPDAPAGSSLERTAAGWAAQAAPTPNVCNAMN